MKEELAILVVPIPASSPKGVRQQAALEQAQKNAALEVTYKTTEPDPLVLVEISLQSPPQDPTYAQSPRPKRAPVKPAQSSICKGICAVQ